MKNVVFIIAIAFLLTSCTSVAEQSSFGESVSIDEFSEAHWLSLPRIEDPFERRVSLGEVEIAYNLNEELKKYTDAEKFVVMICYISMIPENYLDTTMYDGMSASEYLDRYLELKESDPEEAKTAHETYSRLKTEYYYDSLATLSYVGEKRVLGGTCEYNFAFYTCMTKKEILELTCDEDEAFYVFAAIYK